MNPAGGQPLSARLEQLLKEGVDRGQRSEAVFSVILGMVNTGWSWSDYLDAFNESHNALAKYFDVDRRGRSYNRAQRDSLLVREWRRASERVRQSPAVADLGEARQEIALIRTALESAPLKPNDQHVLLAILTIGHRSGRLNPTISQRQLSEMLIMPRTTVRDALARLEEQKRVRVATARGRGHAPTITILKPNQTHRRGDDRIDQPSGARPEFAPSNLWARWGQAARAVYLALDETDRRPAALAHRANVHVRTAQRWIKNLAEVDLALATDQGYVIGPADPDQIALDEKVPDALALLRIRHQLDRGIRSGMAA